MRVRSPSEGVYYEERGAPGTAEQLMAGERRLNLQKEQMKGKHDRVNSQERRVFPEAAGKERPAAPGPGGQGAAPGYPRPPRATWLGISAPGPGDGGTPPAPPDLRERAPGRHPAAAPGAASTHPPCWGSGRRPPRRAPAAGQALREPPPGVRALAPRVRRHREAGRSGPRGAEEGAASPPSSSWVAGLRASGPRRPSPGRHRARSAYPLPGTQVRTAGSPARVLVFGQGFLSPPAAAASPPRPPEWSSGHAARPAAPGALPWLRALALPTSRRPAAPAAGSPSRARRRSSLPAPSSSPARLPPHPARRPPEGGSAPFRSRTRGPSSGPPPPPSPQP
ncbi:skin secretory protein xP2-like [Moschus berezovskii]|uniref:skin secretory protein xP2-like n=1 Tax=Moschus berezovskii TaxID=68408 RepID=UPI002443FD78|nr:skin secretory protein xP2-like [Moschus berezovskii]